MQAPFTRRMLEERFKLKKTGTEQDWFNSRSDNREDNGEGMTGKTAMTENFGGGRRGSQMKEEVELRLFSLCMNGILEVVWLRSYLFWQHLEVARRPSLYLHSIPPYFILLLIYLTILYTPHLLHVCTAWKSYPLLLFLWFLLFFLIWTEHLRIEGGVCCTYCKPLESNLWFWTI